MKVEKRFISLPHFLFTLVQPASRGLWDFVVSKWGMKNQGLVYSSQSYIYPIF